MVALASASLLGLSLSASAAVTTVDLGTASSFAVLAGSGINNTGPTTVTGNIGTFPTPSVTGARTSRSSAGRTTQVTR